MGPQIDAARMQHTAGISAGLLEARDRGELIVCVGPELARSAGLPSMRDLALTLLADAEVAGHNLDAATIRTWIAVGRVDQALEALERRLGARFQRVVERELAELDRPIPALARAIAALAGQLRAVYTTGVDRLLERAFADAWPSFSTVQGDLIRRRKLIVKLCGTLEFPETWVMTRAALEREFGSRALRQQVLAAACRAHCLLFVGFDPADALSERLFSIIDSSEADGPLPSHFVIMEHCAPEERARLERRGLLVLTGDPVTLLESLADADAPATDGAARQLPSCPYPGLQAFDQSLAAVFHGRRAEVSAAASRLGGPESRHRHWLAIDGSSGVGKSSFVHAGLIPALRRGFAEGTPTRWLAATLRPGRQPLHALVDALVATLASKSSPLVPDGDRNVTSPIAEFVREHQAPGTALLLVIDQLEELVTVAEPGERESFGACLSLLLEQRLIYVVTTLRSDFAAAISAVAPAIARLLNEQATRYTLAPISRVGLRAAIAEPATQLGVRFEPELVERIARDAEQHLYGQRTDEQGVVRTDDAALPLVAHVLRGLWDARAAAEGQISFSEYEALGGVSGALSRSADALLAGLNPQERNRVKGLLLRMINLDGERLTRRTVSRTEALSLAGNGREGERLLHFLSGGGGPRLIVIRHDGSDAVVDLVHEALLREWNTLCGWIAADRAQLARDEALARRAAAWADQGRPWRSLPRGPERRELLRGRAHGNGASAQREYQRAMRTAAWLRGVAWLGFCAALAGVGNLVIEQLRWQQAKIAEVVDEGEQNLQALNAQKAKQEIQQLLKDHHCRQAILGILERIPADTELLNRALRCEAVVGELARLGGSPLTAMALDPTQEIAWVGRSDGSVARWDLREHQLELVAKLEHAVDTIQVGPDGERIALRSNGQIRMIARQGQSVGEPCNGQQPSFSPDGRHVALANGRSIELRRSVDGTLAWHTRLDGTAVAFEFSPRSDQLIVGNALQAGSSILTLDVATGQIIGAIEVPKYLRDIAVSSDGRLVASTADDKYVRLFSLASGEEVAASLRFDAREAKRQLVSFSTTGELLLTVGENDSFVVTGLDLVPLGEAEGVDSRVWPQFSPGGQWLLTAGFGPHAALRAARTGDEVARLELGSKASAVALRATPSPDRGGALILAERGELLDWAVDTRDHWRAPNGHAQGVRSLAFSADDPRRLLSGSSAGTVQAWAIGTEQRSPAVSLSGWIMALGTAPGADRNFAFTDDGKLYSWSSDPTGEPRALLTTCASKIAAVSGAGERLAVACDHQIQLYDLTRSQPEQIAAIATELDVNAIAISVAGDRLALGSSNGDIDLLQVGDGSASERERLAGAHAGAVTGLGFDRRGELLVSGGNDDFARLWPLADGPRRARELSMSGHNVESVAVSAFVAVGDEQGTIAVWDLDGIEQHRFKSACLDGRVHALTFSPDDQLLAAGCSDGSVHAWPIGGQAALELACERLANTTLDAGTLPSNCHIDD